MGTEFAVIATRICRLVFDLPFSENFSEEKGNLGGK